MKLSELELLSVRGGRAGGGEVAAPPVVKKINSFGQNWSTFRAVQKGKENLYLYVLTYQSAAIPYFVNTKRLKADLNSQYAIKELWFASQNAGNRISDDLHFKISRGGGYELTKRTQEKLFADWAQ